MLPIFLVAFLLPYSLAAQQPPAASAPNALSAYLDRSYYTIEKEAVAVCEIEGPERLGDAVLVVKDAKGNPLGKSDVQGRVTRISIALDKLPVGAHPLAVELRSKKNETLLSRALELIKREPKPGFEWKIDQVNRIVLRDGQPFFPIGMVMSGMVAPRDEASFREVAELGFNTVIRWYSGADPATATALHDLAAKYHLYVIDPPDRFAKDNLIRAKAQPDFDDLVAANLDRMAAAVNKVKDSPRLASYYALDEPDKNQIKSGRMLYHKQQELDGYHPSMILYSSGIPAGDQFIDWCDILSTDPYWTPVGEGVRGSINWMSKIVTATRERGEPGRKVTWILPMGEFWSGISKRAILPKEQFAQTYLALIHGAKGIIYFRYPFIHQTALDTLGMLTKELAVLGPIAVTPDVAQTVHYSPDPFDPEKDKYPDVQVSLRRNPAGGYVLLAANTRAFPVEVKVHLSNLGPSGAVKNLFNSNQHPISGGSFSDRLEFNDTRAYTFQASEPIQEPVDLVIEETPHPEQTDPIYGAPGLPNSGRPDKKNVLRNPGFEEAAFSDWPDYYAFIMDGPRLGRGDPQTIYGLDTANPFEGKNCLWIRASEKKGKFMFYQTCVPALKEPHSYTLSAYMRADRDGVKVHFVGLGWRIPKPTFGYKEFTLTTKWQRYTETTTLPPKLFRSHSVGVEIVADQNATVFFDAMQLEQGDEATAFEP